MMNTRVIFHYISSDLEITLFQGHLKKSCEKLI